MLNRLNHLNTTTANFKNTVLLDEDSKAEAEAGVPLNRHQRRRYRARGRRWTDSGDSRAVRKAFTGAILYMRGEESSLRAAAGATGSNPAYVKMVVTLVQSEDQQLLHHVLRGNIPLRLAAQRAKPVADLVTAFRAAGPTDLSKAGSIVTPTAVWDGMISPIV